MVVSWANDNSVGPDSANSRGVGPTTLLGGFSVSGLVDFHCAGRTR